MGSLKRSNDDKSSDTGKDARKGSSSSDDATYAWQREIWLAARLQGPEAQEAAWQAYLEAKANMLKARLLKGRHAEDKRRRV